MVCPVFYHPLYESPQSLFPESRTPPEAPPAPSPPVSGPVCSPSFRSELYPYGFPCPFPDIVKIVSPKFLFWRIPPPSGSSHKVEFDPYNQLFPQFHPVNYRKFSFSKRTQPEDFSRLWKSPQSGSPPAQEQEKRKSIFPGRPPH